MAPQANHLREKARRRRIRRRLDRRSGLLAFPPRRLELALQRQDAVEEKTLLVLRLARRLLVRHERHAQMFHLPGRLAELLAQRRGFGRGRGRRDGGAKRRVRGDFFARRPREGEVFLPLPLDGRRPERVRIRARARTHARQRRTFVRRTSEVRPKFRTRRRRRLQRGGGGFERRPQRRGAVGGEASRRRLPRPRELRAEETVHRRPVRCRRGYFFRRVPRGFVFARVVAGSVSFGRRVFFAAAWSAWTRVFVFSRAGLEVGADAPDDVGSGFPRARRRRRDARSEERFLRAERSPRVALERGGGGGGGVGVARFFLGGREDEALGRARMRSRARDRGGGGVLGRRRGVPGVETRGVVVVVGRGVRRADVSGSWRGRRRPLARVGALVVVRGGRGGGDPERPRSAHGVAERAGDGADDGTPRGRGRGRAHRRAERARASGGAREAMTRRARRAARPRFGVTRSIGRKRPRLRPERTRGIRRSGVRSSRAAVSFRRVSRW